MPVSHGSFWFYHLEKEAQKLITKRSESKLKQTILATTTYMYNQILPTNTATLHKTTREKLHIDIPDHGPVQSWENLLCILSAGCLLAEAGE